MVVGIRHGQVHEHVISHPWHSLMTPVFRLRENYLYQNYGVINCPSSAPLNDLLQDSPGSSPFAGNHELEPSFGHALIIVPCH